MIRINKERLNNNKDFLDYLEITNTNEIYSIDEVIFLRKLKHYDKKDVNFLFFKEEHDHHRDKGYCVDLYFEQIKNKERHVYIQHFDKMISNGPCSERGYNFLEMPINCNILDFLQNYYEKNLDILIMFVDDSGLYDDH